MKRKELFKLKKSLRITALILSAILLCSLFTGCDELDEMKAQHAILNEDGNIHLNGSEYIPINTVRKASFYFNFNLVQSDYIYVTAPDVPVLLSESHCIFTGEASSDGKYLYTYNSKNYDKVYYCRADEYDSHVERLEKPFEPEVLAYHYYYYDTELGEQVSGNYILSPEEKSAVEAVLALDVTERVENYNEHEVYSYCHLYECSEDLIFNRSGAYGIEYHNGRYSVMKDPDGTVTERYRIPLELESVFQNIMLQQFKTDHVLWDFVNNDPV